MSLLILLSGCGNRYGKLDIVVDRFTNNNLENWDISNDVNFYGPEGIEYLIENYKKSHDVVYLRILAYSNYKITEIKGTIEYQIGKLEGSLNIIEKRSKSNGVQYISINK